MRVISTFWGLTVMDIINLDLWRNVLVIYSRPVLPFAQGQKKTAACSVFCKVYFCFSSFFNTDFSWWSQWKLCRILYLCILYQNPGLITTTLYPFLIYWAFHAPLQLYVSHLFIMTVFSLSSFAKSSKKAESYIIFYCAFLHFFCLNYSTET